MTVSHAEQSSVEKTTAPYVNDFEQTVENVALLNWDSWLQSHKNCEIIAIASYDGRTQSNFGSSSPTTCFIVVYRKKHE
jgi:hypothetical protein